MRKGIIKINTKFHQPSTVTLLRDGKEETIDFGYTTIGYNFEIIHFNELLRSGIKESPVMNFDFSRTLMKLLDDVRHNINLIYQ